MLQEHRGKCVHHHMGLHRGGDNWAEWKKEQMNGKWINSIACVVDSP